MKKFDDTKVSFAFPMGSVKVTMVRDLANRFSRNRHKQTREMKLRVLVTRKGSND